MIDKLENTLNGGYAGLYGEVVKFDCYKLKELKFIPDVVLDIGANVGIFTRYVRQLFPDCFILSIEPDIDNYTNIIMFTKTDNMVLLNEAIGIGDVYRIRNSINGAHEIYINEDKGEQTEKVNIKCRMLDELIDKAVKPKMKSILKLDIEGNEEIIWQHEPSMQALKKIDYFAGEIHYTMLEGNEREKSKQKSLTALHSFDDTHNVVIDGTSFWATKK